MLMSFGFDRLARLLQVGSRLERVLHRGVDVHGHRLERRQLGRLDPRRPEVGRRRVEDERAQRVFGVVDIAPCATITASCARRDFGFGLDDVDRRRGADLDARARVAQRLAARDRATAAAPPSEAIA